MIAEDSFVLKRLSYIKARDPSLLAGNLGVLPSVRKNLARDFSEAIKESEENKDNDHIEIFVRLRNSDTVSNNLYDICDDAIVCNVPQTSQWYRNQKSGSLVRRTYKFSKIFNTTAKQGDIFNNIVRPRLFSFINGRDSTILTYGISGSGKTFTIMGDDKHPGLIPRAFEYLFKTIKVSKQPFVKPLPNGGIVLLNQTDSAQEINICKNLIASNNSIKTNYHKQYLSMQQRLSCEPAAFIENESDLTFEIWVSFVEIYNENIYDLLQINDKNIKTRPKLRLGLTDDDNNGVGSSYVKDIKIINVTTPLEAYQLMQYGLQNLNYASTLLNSHSSRSHAIFTIKLVQISKQDNGVYISNFNFCDLAGSERLKKTMNIGKRLQESNSINLSLLVLSRCIKGVYNIQNTNNDKTQLPFRESKLTQLFQNALSGNEDICMIVTINLNPMMFDETLHVLHLAAIANDIQIDTNTVKRNKNKCKKLAPPPPPPPSSRGDGEYSNNKDDDDDDCGSSSSTPDSYIQELENAVMALHNELEQMKIEHEEHQSMEHQRLVKGYSELLDSKERFWQKRLHDEINDLKEEYEDKIESIKEKYEEKLFEQQEFFLMKIHRLRTTKQSEVIEISDDDNDDDDDSNGDGKKKLEINEEIQQLSNENLVLKNDNDDDDDP